MQVSYLPMRLVEKQQPQKKLFAPKTIDLEPMDLDEAILQMDLLAHDFFILS